VASYPGTPASEILSAFVQMAKTEGIPAIGEWSINERVYGALAYLVTNLDRPSSSPLPGSRRGVISGWEAMGFFEGGLLHCGFIAKSTLKTR
jgi:TPP-dependent indolepyruvate ferredoxin oxidoreductase alpha subunit